MEFVLLGVHTLLRYRVDCHRLIPYAGRDVLRYA